MALADKLDTLVGFWAIGEKPTGSGDPYQLRRAALGVIRIVLENDLRLPLAASIAEAYILHYGREQPAMPRHDLRDQIDGTLKQRGLTRDNVFALFSRRR